MDFLRPGKTYKKGNAFQQDTIDRLAAEKDIIPAPAIDEMRQEWENLERDKAELESLKGYNALRRSKAFVSWKKSTKSLNSKSRVSSSDAKSRMLRGATEKKVNTDTIVPNAMDDLEDTFRNTTLETPSEEFMEDQYDDILYTEATEEMLGKYAEIVQSKEECSKIQGYTKDEAQDQVEELDKILRIIERRGDYSNLEFVILGLLRRLCGDNGLYPRSFRLYGVVTNEIELGRGAYGVVSKGMWGSQLVAVKRPISPQDIFDRKTSCKEAAVWAYVRHPNIVPFYGITTLRGQNAPCMVSKLMVNGTMTSYLLKWQSANRPKLILGIASGLQYLHDRSILHGDLKCLNILVDHNDNPCLGDFGFAGLRYDDHVTFVEMSSRTGNGGTALWVAPEILYPIRFGRERAFLTKESDVWSLSLVMWEIFTGTAPFEDLRIRGYSLFDITDRVSRGHRSLRPKETTVLGAQDEIWSIMDRCLQATPTLRPSITSIRRELEAFVEHFDHTALQAPQTWPLQIEPAGE